MDGGVKSPHRNGGINEVFKARHMPRDCGLGCGHCRAFGPDSPDELRDLTSSHLLKERGNLATDVSRDRTYASGFPGVFQDLSLNTKEVFGSFNLSAIQSFDVPVSFAFD
jgi:hypothetical protein